MSLLIFGRADWFAGRGHVTSWDARGPLTGRREFVNGPCTAWEEEGGGGERCRLIMLCKCLFKWKSSCPKRRLIDVAAASLSLFVRRGINWKEKCTGPPSRNMQMRLKGRDGVTFPCVTLRQVPPGGLVGTTGIFRKMKLFDIFFFEMLSYFWVERGAEFF